MGDVQAMTAFRASYLALQKTGASRIKFGDASTERLEEWKVEFTDTVALEILNAIAHSLGDTHARDSQFYKNEVMADEHYPSLVETCRILGVSGSDVQSAIKSTLADYYLDEKAGAPYTYIDEDAADKAISAVTDKIAFRETLALSMAEALKI
jgi:hypothetical protein